MLRASRDVSAIYNLMGDDWLSKQRIAGGVVSKVLDTMEKLVIDKTSLSTLELSKIAEEIIIDNGCTPTFKGYAGFPEACCISINSQLVHGIPNEYRLQDGDLVSFDLGATYGGAIADAARTFIFGEPKSNEHARLLSVTNKALGDAIKSISIDCQLGIIGECIYKAGRANGYGVVTQLGGHFLDWNIPHASPFVSNRDISTNGIRFQSGMTLCIEPLFCIGDPKTKKLSDGWTIETDGLSCHAESTIYIHSDRVEIIV